MKKNVPLYVFICNVLKLSNILNQKAKIHLIHEPLYHIMHFLPAPLAIPLLQPSLPWNIARL